MIDPPKPFIQPDPFFYIARKIAAARPFVQTALTKS
jgi:hypothetical protein